MGGDNIYGGQYYFCDYLIPPSTLLEAIDCNKLLSLSGFPRPVSSYISTDPFGVCMCSDCTIRSLHKQIYPGQSITLSLLTVGWCGGISPGVLLTQSNGVDVVLGTSNQQTEKTCKTLHIK